MSKPRIIKDFVKLDPAIQEQIKLNYPDGFEQNLISFNDAKGNKVSALPFETEEVYYLVRMTVTQAQVLIEEDDDYDDSGVLKSEIKEEYEAKYVDEDEEDAVDSDDEEDDY